MFCRKAVGNFLRPVLFLLFFVFSDGALSQNTVAPSEFETAYSLYKSHQFHEALQICEKGNNLTPEQKAACLLIKGFVWMDSLSYEESEPFFLEAEPLLRHSKKIKLKAKYRFGLGKIYFNTARFQESIKEFLILEKLAIQNQMKAEEKSANYYLAQNFQKLSNMGLSNRYARRGILLSKELNDTASVIRNYLALISNYNAAGFQQVNEGNEGKKDGFAKGNLYGDSALGFIKEVSAFVPKTGNTQLGNLYDAYSGAYSCKREFKKSLRFAILSFDQLVLSGDMMNATACCNKIGDAFNDLKQYDSALVYMKKAAVMRKEIPQAEVVLDERPFNYSFYRAYNGLHQYKEALEYLEKYLKQDLELNESRNIELQKIREKFETEKTNFRIQTETERTRNLFEQKRKLYLIASLAILLFMSLIAWFLYYRFKTRKEQEEKNLQILLQTAELSALKAQMNPHFIFNALNSIQHSIVTNNTEEAYRFLSKFSRLIRNVLDSSAEPLIPLNTEIETLSLYMEIESKRFDHSFSFVIEVEDSGNKVDSVQIPPMVLQPFVENAIWHGLMPKDGNKNLSIVFSFPGENVILCVVSDNGIGREKAAVLAAQKGKTHRSRGISNIMDRVKLLEMTLGITVSIQTLDLPDADGNSAGTQVTILFTKTGNL